MSKLLDIITIKSKDFRLGFYQNWLAAVAVRLAGF